MHRNVVEEFAVHHAYLTPLNCYQHPPFCPAPLCVHAVHRDVVEEFAAHVRLWGPDLGAWPADKRVVALQVGRAGLGCGPGPAGQGCSPLGQEGS